MKFFTLCPKVGALDSLFCPEGRVFVHNDCAGGTVLLPSSRVLSRGVAPGGGDGFGWNWYLHYEPKFPVDKAAKVGVQVPAKADFLNFPFTIWLDIKHKI